MTFVGDGCAAGVVDCRRRIFQVGVVVGREEKRVLCIVICGCQDNGRKESEFPRRVEIEKCEEEGGKSELYRVM